MMRKRNSYPTITDDSTNEKRERKSPSGDEELTMDARTGNGRSGSDEEMINVVDVSDSEERMDVSDIRHSSAGKEEMLTVPGPSIIVESSSSISTLSTSSSTTSSLPLDLSKKKRRLTASTSLTEDNDHKDDDEDYSDSDQRQRKGIAGFSGQRGGSFGAGSTSSSSSSNIKWRRQPLECEIPSRGESPSVIVAGTTDICTAAGLQQQAMVIRSASDAWKIQQQQRPSVIRSADFTFEPPESNDVDEHFRKSLGGNQPTAEAAVDDHFARALGDVWWALKNRMHLTSTGEDGSAPRVSPSPATPPSTTMATSNCIVASSFSSTSSSNSQMSETVTKSSLSTSFPSSTPLKKRILSKAAVEAAAQRLEMNSSDVVPVTNNYVESGRDGNCDRINNNTTNVSLNSDEDSRKSLSAPSTPPPTPL